MTIPEVKAQIERHEAELRAMGVRRLELFGSVAKGRATEESELDFLLELQPSSGLFIYDALQQDILEGAIPCLTIQN